MILCFIKTVALSSCYLVLRMASDWGEFVALQAEGDGGAAAEEQSLVEEELQVLEQIKRERLVAIVASPKLTIPDADLKILQSAHDGPWAVNPLQPHFNGASMRTWRRPRCFVSDRSALRPLLSLSRCAHVHSSSNVGVLEHLRSVHRTAAVPPGVQPCAL